MSAMTSLNEKKEAKKKNENLKDIRNKLCLIHAFSIS